MKGEVDFGATFGVKTGQFTMQLLSSGWAA